MLAALYGLSGIGVAAALSWAAFTVAGHQLSTPADPIQPVGVAVTTPSGSVKPEQESSARPSAKQSHRSTPSQVPAPVPTGAPTAARSNPPATIPIATSPPAHPSPDDGHGDD
jgi:hypothetical protein